MQREARVSRRGGDAETEARPRLLIYFNGFNSAMPAAKKAS